VLGGEANPIARAERVELIFALSPLLAGIVLIDSAVVVGAQLRVLRTGDGFHFGEAGDSRPDSGPVDIVLRDLELRGAALLLEDRTVAPPLRWKVQDLWARVFAEAVDSPIQVELAGELASGGKLTIQGELARAGDLDLELSFDSLAIAAAKPYFESPSEQEGFLTGSIRATGSVAKPSLELDAHCLEARLHLGEIALFGLLKITAHIDDAREAPRGRIDFDATQATLSYAEFFTKAPGTAASVTGTIGHNPDGSLSVDAWKFVMKDFEGRGSISPLAPR
jgi:hypothetical protein